MAKLMCAKCGGKVKMANGGTTPKPVLAKAKTQMYGIPQENLGTSGQFGFAKKGGSITSRPVKHSCPPGTVRSATGGCVSERPKFQTGGSAKKAKFAALAPPYNKATFADRIAGAKKKK
jgi:hypothetical protein